MEGAPAKAIFLTGAPEQDSVDWNEDGLTSSLLLPVRRFLGEAGRNDSDAETPASQRLPKWRHIPVAEQQDHVHKAVTRSPKAAHFWSPQDQDAASARQMDFLEHSLAVMQNLESSQIEPPENTAPHETSWTSISFDASSSTDLSLTESSDSLATYSSEKPEQQIVTFNGPITDLRSVPNARHILSIYPQTMTVNILAGIIAIHPTRTVRTRRNNMEMDIIEVILGDETRAGFSVSFWLPTAENQYAQQSPNKQGLRAVLTGLQNGDVVLLTHVALSNFQGNVYGQSLSRRITRNNTTVTVLSDNLVGLSAQKDSKLERVRKWSADYIGKKRARSPSLPRGDGQKHRKTLELPPDTQ